MLRKTLQSTTALALISITPGLAAAQEQTPIDIPAQDLAAAIAELGDETGLQVGISDDLAEGKPSAAVRGPMMPNEALQQLLAGTGLSVQPVGDSGSVVTSNLVLQNTTEEPFDLGTLVLRGELIDRDLQDSQTSAVIVTGEELETRSDQDVRDIFRRTPGVSVAGTAPIPTIRGVNQRGASANGSSLISLTVDGAAISDFGLLVENGPYSTWDLEQVEILRGPQSTQSGRNALAGSINIRSRDPFMGEEFKYRLEYGTDNTAGVSFAYNTANDEETLALRFSADLRETDGFSTNSLTGADDIGRNEDRTYRIGILWEPNDRLSAVFKYTRSEIFTGTPYVEENRFPAGRFNDSNVPAFYDTDFDIANFRLSYDINSNWDLQFESSFMQSDFLQTFDSDFSAADLGDGARFRDFENRQYELKFLYSGARATGVVGLLYAEIETDDLTLGTFPFGATFATLRAEGNSEATNTALFGEVEYDIGRGFSVIGGLRYDREKQEAFQNRVITGGPFPVEPPTFTDTTFNAFLPKLGVVYDFDEYRSLGFTIQRGYRAGGARSVPNFGIVAFDPEYTTNYEIAYRSESPDGAWLLNANAFYTRWEDQQVSLGTTALDTRTVNAGESEYYGFEIDTKWQPTDALDLYFSAAYVQTEFLDFVDGATVFTGNEFRDAPDISATLGGTYSFDNGAYVSSDISYTASSFSDAANTVENDASLVTNLRIGYRQDNWEVLAYVRNLFDDEYLFGQAPTAAGPITFAGDPRTIGVVFQATF